MKTIALLALYLALVASAHAALPSDTAMTGKSETQALQPKGPSTKKIQSTSSVEHTMEWEDTDEYVFLVCVRKLLKGPKGFCEREDVKAILPELQKVPKSKEQPDEEVFKSHRDGEATVFTHMLIHKRAERMMALGSKIKSKVWHNAKSVANALGPERIAKLMTDFLNSPAGKEGGEVGGASVASVEAGDNIKNAAKSKDKKNAAKKAKFRSQLGKVQHQLSLLEQTTTVRSTAEMVTPYKRPWKNGIVHYEFEGVGPTQRATLYGLFLESIWKYQNNTCARFEPKQVGTTRFTVLAGGPGAEGSFSRGLGNTSSRVQIAETMTDQKVVDHEFGHLLGLLHTNKRKDRDDWVNVNRTKCDNYFRKYVKRHGEFQLECRKEFKRWQDNNWIQLSGGFYDTWRNAPTAGVEAAFDAFDAELPRFVRRCRTNMNNKLAAYNKLWNLGIFNRKKRTAALQAYNDAKDLYDLAVSDLDEWDDLKRRVMKDCLDGWFYQYEQDPTATDHGAIYDYRSIMHYAFDTREPVEEQCMMPKVPNKDGSRIPSRVGSYKINRHDYAAVRANLGCQNTRTFWICRGSNTNCPIASHRSVHRTWNMKDFLEIVQADHGLEIDQTTLEKKEGGTWTAVNFQPTDTLEGLGLLDKRLRFCEGCNAGGGEESSSSSSSSSSDESDSSSGSESDSSSSSSD